ncbi:hypothetical protein [Palleronia rufa]|uniref:hypothetical protein n=1 Tax=Palleronia rufa TaxID=1530186 RepID=UPI0012678CF3
MTGEFLCGVRARVHAGFGPWHLGFASKAPRTGPERGLRPHRDEAPARQGPHPGRPAEHRGRPAGAGRRRAAHPRYRDDRDRREMEDRARDAGAGVGVGWIRFHPRKATAEPVVTPFPAGRPWPAGPPSAKRSACRTARRGPGPSTSSRSARLPCRPTNRAKT